MFHKNIRKKSVVPEFIWVISLVVISVSLIIMLKGSFTKISDKTKDININLIKSSLSFKVDNIDGIWLTKLEFKVPKGYDDNTFINNLDLICLEDNLSFKVKDLVGKFLEKDQRNYYVLTKSIHLYGPDESTVLYYTFEDCSNDSNITKDYSGNRNHGYIYGNLRCLKGLKGKAIYFSSPSQYISSKYANSVSNKTLSYCNWINIEDVNYENQFIYISTGFRNISKRFFYFSTWCGDGMPYNCAHGGSVDSNGHWGRSYVTSRHLKTNKWYFLCQQIDTINGKIEYWNNGNLYTRININKGDIKGVAKNIWIGGTPENRQRLIGKMEEAILFNRLLNEYEIKSMYKFKCFKPNANWALFLGKPEEEGILLAKAKIPYYGVE